MRAHGIIAVAQLSIYSTNVVDADPIRWRFASCDRWPSRPLLAATEPDTLVFTSGRCLHHLNASSGDELWRRDISAVRSSAPALDEDGSVVFYGREDASGLRVLEAVSLPKQQRLWVRDVEGMPSQPVVAGNGQFVLFGDETSDSLGNLYCLNATDGTVNWHIPMAGSIRKAPSLSHSGERVYVSDAAQTLSAVDVASGDLAWSFQTSDYVHSSPLEHPDGSLVFVGTHRYNLHALNSSTGKLAWSFSTKGFVVSVPVLSAQGDRLYCIADDGYVYALEATTGKLLWSVDVCVGCELPPHSEPRLSLDGRYLFVGAGEQRIVAMDVTQGTVEWDVKMPGMVYAQPALSKDQEVLFVSSGGFLGGSVSALLVASGSDIEASTTCPTTSSWPPSQMSDNSHCSAIGLKDLSPYRYGLPLPSLSGLKEEASASDPSGFVPYFSTEPLDGPSNAGITNAVIWMHGLHANANKFFCDGIAAASAAGASRQTLTIAPWFGDEKMVSSIWPPTGATPYGNVSTCWKTSSWLKGGNSYPSASGGRSTFALMDALIEAVLSSSSFPNLQQITVAGYSAGCQLTTRWVLFSDTAKQVTLIAGDCGTYMFLDGNRPADSCNSPMNTGVNHSCSSFSKPVTACSSYNDYKYGLDLSVVQNNNYVEAFASDSKKLAQAISEFPQKKVHFLHGDLDVCQCNLPSMNNQGSCFPKGSSCSPTEFGGCCDTYPDSTTGNSCSYTCEAVTGGTNRLQRGLNYADYLSSFYGGKYTASVGIFQGAHDNTAWSLSPQFSQWAGWTSASTSAYV